MSIRTGTPRRRGSWIALIALIAAGILLLQPAFAHSPTDMQLSYDPVAHQLAVTITHQVPDPAAHYVREVAVRVNGQAAVTRQYTGQPSSSSFTYTYPLRAGTGDTIEVYAPCSLGGSITRSITVSGNETGAASPGATPPSPTKSPPAIVLTPAVLALLLVVRNNNPA
jgi:hypothetical protein